MYKHPYVLSLITFIWSCFSFFAQDHIQFKSFTINDGLSQSVVSCVVQDELGALWIGTQDGINRFNGNNFEVFNTDKEFDISNEFILTVKKDEFGNIWFGTYDGLIRYNLRSEEFTSFLLKKNNRIEIKAIDVDDNGNVWVGTAFGSVYKLDLKKEKFLPVGYKVFESGVVDIKVDNNKVLVISEYDGVVITDKTFSNSKKYLLKGKTKNIVASKFLDHPTEKILIASSAGVFAFNEKTNQFVLFEEKILNRLNELKIKDIVFLSKDRYFIATENAGLFQVNNLNDSTIITNYQADFYQKNSLISDKLNTLYQDKKGNIWITSQRGLSVFDPYSTGFKGVGFSGNLKKGLPSQSVWGFHEDKDADFLYIAADHGVTRFDKRKHEYHHFFRKVDRNEDFTTLGVYVINKDTILVAAIDGFYELYIDSEDPLNHTYRKISQKIDSQRGFEKVYTILPFKNENKYLLGSKGGLAIYNRSTNEFEYFYSDKEDSSSIGAGPVRLIFKTKQGRYFVSPSSGGIYEVVYTDTNGFKIEKASLFNKLSNKTKDYFTSVNQISDNEYWFGTIGDGMYYLNTKSEEIKHFNKSKGLSNNVIYSIKSIPNDKNLWLSTNRGIVKYNIDENSFTFFSEADGLMSDELNLGASFVSKTGEIYFGGIQGYNYFNPKKPLTKSSKLSVYFSRIEIENKIITPKKSDYLEKSISFTKSIKLPYKQRSLNLFFFADELNNPDRIEYKYILEGDDDVEENIGKINQLRFTSLSPGQYKLSVYARTLNGEWNENPAELVITVESPFWLTWWFYSVIIAIVVLLVISQVRKSIDKERRQQVKLELKIAERTKEIRAKTEKIETQKQKLENQKVELEKEKEKSERLLNNLLPKETASQLKNYGHSTARDFNMVSVMFTDFVGFTGIAENMSAKDLVNILDGYFTKFDQIIEDHDLEKIKTIGDAYMCAGGVPIRNKTNPINTVLAAIRIQDYMRECKEEAQKKDEFLWRLRIGINTGPVSAGVIGSKKYAYDVWGKTVNRAQRMEQMCEPEKIAITEDTFEHIEPYFECEPKGKVKTKAGLEIMMYEVISIKPELSEKGKGIIPNDSFHKLVNLHFFSKINYYKAERYILAKLKKELSPKLHYHSYDHSKDVTRQAERIAIGEGITDEDLFLLKSAASYHDAGFVKQYDKNEPVGAAMAQEILPNFGYTQTHIDRIKELIYVTQIPHQPKNKLEEIICDADLDYLGRDDFHEIADRLRVELREHGKIDSDRKWDEIQVSFLTQHRFFTKTSIETRRAKKRQNLQEIKDRLEQKNYKD